MNSKVTIVTGLWDLKRGDLEGWANRSFETYKSHFFKLLETDAQLCIWIPKELEKEVREIRKDRPTAIYFKELEDFKTWNPFFNKIQEIRTDTKWIKFASWLEGSPQGALEFYNPMMMCKMFMVNDSAIFNPFNSEYFYWIDGGITSTVNPGYFTHDKVLDNLENYSISRDKFTFLQYPYEANEEIHGFERKALAKYCNTDFVSKVSRGGFFGGHKDLLNEINGLYYGYLESTLTNGLMGADESVFTILSHRHPDIINNFQLEGNGLVYPFFEELKKYKEGPLFNDRDVILYVITYNSPNQFETLIKSLELYDKDYLTKTRKILLNNSIDRGTDERYAELCKEHNFEEIKKDNIGICGGRQFIAEHFEEHTTGTHYLFFEDDMFFYNGKEQFCKNGFRRYISKLFLKSLHIAQLENFDFLKLNFTEFFGDNQKQWSWHNVSEETRAKLFPDVPKKTSPDVNAAPYLNFNNIKTYKGIPYATGEIYYCNWPQIVSREGNRKMFLETKWEHPYEQTWMSHFFQLTRKGELNPGLLLATPTEHDRFEFYPKEERREN